MFEFIRIRPNRNNILASIGFGVVVYCYANDIRLPGEDEVLPSKVEVLCQVKVAN